MANKIYPKYKKAAMTTAANDILLSNIVVKLIDLADYTYSDAHEFVSDIPSAAVVSTSPVLTGKTLSDLAAFDSDDPVMATVAGDQSEAIILCIDSGVPATSRLIAFQDTGVTGLPITPNGGNITVTVAAGGWFTL